MLQQSIQYGSSMYEQLVELAREIREVQLLATEEKIGQLGAKMSVPLILFFMFPVIIIVAAPGVMRLMGNMGN
ncbi:type II secretion system F family protein [Tatumella sp. JGM91]|nr:type II secretion system F family protein [Tatumella sp. JGM91]